MVTQGTSNNLFFFCALVQTIDSIINEIFKVSFYKVYSSAQSFQKEWLEGNYFRNILGSSSGDICLNIYIH